MAAVSPPSPYSRPLWHQLEDETLQDFLLALLSLMARVERQAPNGIPII